MRDIPKFVMMDEPATGATNAYATSSCDCQGFRYAVVTVKHGTAATNKALSELILYDNTSASTTSATTLATGGTDFTIGAPSTSASKAHRFLIDLRGKERYLVMKIKPATAGMTFEAFADLYRGDSMPNTTTEAGLITLHEIA